jgi:hypothetical protein
MALGAVEEYFQVREALVVWLSIQNRTSPVCHSFLAPDRPSSFNQQPQLALHIAPLQARRSPVTSWEGNGSIFLAFRKTARLEHNGLRCDQNVLKPTPSPELPARGEKTQRRIGTCGRVSRLYGREGKRCPINQYLLTALCRGMADHGHSR